MNMKSIDAFYKKLSDDAKYLFQVTCSVQDLYQAFGKIEPWMFKYCLNMQNKEYKVEDRDPDGFLYGTHTVSVNIPNLDQCKEEIKVMLAEYTEYKARMDARAEARKAQKETENAIELLSCTMIPLKEAREMLKEIGCALFQKSGIKVQEWVDSTKTKFWVKARHTKMKIKCRYSLDGQTVCKEDILKAIA